MTHLERQQLELRGSFEATGLCKVLAIQTRPTCIQMTLSVPVDNLVRWGEWLTSFLIAVEQLAVDVFVGQKFSVAGGRLVAGWVFKLDVGDAEDLFGAVAEVRTVMMRSVNPAVDEPRAVDHSWFRELMFEDRGGRLEQESHVR